MYSDFKVTVQTGGGTLQFAVNPDNGKLELRESSGGADLWMLRLGPDSLVAGLPATPGTDISIVATMTQTPESPEK